MTYVLKSKPEETAATSGGFALGFGIIGAGLGYLVKHPTIGAVAGATIGASAGASMAHLFEDANFFGSRPQPEMDAITSDITKVSVASALGAVVAGTVGAKTIVKHPTVAALVAASAGSALAAALADAQFGSPTGQLAGYHNPEFP